MVDEGDRDTVPIDKYHKLLGNSRRRDVLVYLKENRIGLEEDGGVTLRDLTEAIAAREESGEPGEFNSDLRDSVYISLYQTHLDKLEDQDVIGYDSDRKVVWRGPKFWQTRKGLRNDFWDEKQYIDTRLRDEIRKSLDRTFRTYRDVISEWPQGFLDHLKELPAELIDFERFEELGDIRDPVKHGYEFDEEELLQNLNITGETEEWDKWIEDVFHWRKKAEGTTVLDIANKAEWESQLEEYFPLNYEAEEKVKSARDPITPLENGLNEALQAVYPLYNSEDVREEILGASDRSEIDLSHFNKGLKRANSEFRVVELKETGSDEVWGKHGLEENPYLIGSNRAGSGLALVELNGREERRGFRRMKAEIEEELTL